MHKIIKAAARIKLLTIMTLFFGYLTGFSMAVFAAIVRGEKLLPEDFGSIWILVGTAAAIGLGAILICLVEVNTQQAVAKKK